MNHRLTFQSRALMTCLLFLVLGSVPVMSQILARVRGTVKSLDGKTIEGARVVLIFSEDKSKVEYVTDKKGSWKTHNLRSGTWTIGFMAEGFKPENINVTFSAIKKNPDIHMKLAPLPKSPLLKPNKLYKEGKYAEAIKGYREALNADPDLPGVMEKIGISYFKLGDKAKAMEAFKKVLEKHPDSQAVLINISSILLEEGQLEEGMNYFKKLNEASIKDHSVFYNIGILLFNKGKMKEAIDYFGKAVTRKPDYVQGHYQLALACLNTGDMERAKKGFNEVIKMAPDSEQATQSKEMLKALQ